MTTIAYRDGVMACDSQVTFSEVKYAKAKKIRKLADGSLIGVCGDWPAAYRLMTGIRDDGTIGADLLDSVKGASAILVRPDASMWIVQGGARGGCVPVFGPFLTDGSGFNVALAAMKAGANAKRAVEIAAELDVNSSLPIFTESLGPVVVKPKGRKGRK